MYTRSTPEGWPTPPGRVTRQRIVDLTIPASDAPGVFVCGPTGFVEAVARSLVDLGHAPQNVKTERFGGS